MLPYQREHFQAKLTTMGCASYLVERMKPWSLISSYSFRMNQKAKQKTTGNTMVWDPRSNKYVYVTSGNSVYMSDKKFV